MQFPLPFFSSIFFPYFHFPASRVIFITTPPMGIAISFGFFSVFFFLKDMNSVLLPGKIDKCRELKGTDTEISTCLYYV